MTAAAALFSTAGATTVSSAAATTAVLNTGEGRQFRSWLSEELFDEALGMRPKTASMFGNMFAYMGVNMGFQFGFARLFGANKAITDIRDVSTDKRMAESVVREGKGINWGTKPEIDLKTGDLRYASKLLYSGKEAVGVTAEALKIAGQPQHIGIVLKGLETQSSMASFFTQPVKALSQGYLTFGISHQAVNISLINAGYSSTITSIGGGWSTIPSTFVYGPYGGGLTGAVTYEKTSNK